MLKPIVLALTVSLALAASCKKEETSKKDAPATKTKDVAPASNLAPTPVGPTEADTTAALAIMAPYEMCREKLATDTNDVTECAQAIADAAGKKTDGVAADSMKEIATAAAALVKHPADDIEKLRLAFGEVSKPVEAMLTAIPAAAAKYKMYECPMAKGFKRWAQPMAEGKVAIANPYMGTKMLDCGSEVHDHHGDMKHGDMKHGDIKHGQ